MRLGVGKAYKHLKLNNHLGDPGFPRPTADRGEGAQGNHDGPPQENYGDLGRETVNPYFYLISMPLNTDSTALHIVGYKIKT